MQNRAKKTTGRQAIALVAGLLIVIMTLAGLNSLVAPARAESLQQATPQPTQSAAERLRSRLVGNETPTPEEPEEEAETDAAESEESGDDSAPATATSMPTPVRTATPEPPADSASLQDTVAAGIAQLRSAQPAFSDDFSSPNANWEEPSNPEMFELLPDAGELWVMVDTENTLTSRRLDAPEMGEFGHYLLEVDVQPSLLSLRMDNNYGLVFQVADNSNYYLYSVGHDTEVGVYSLRRLVAREWETLIDWTPSPAFELGRRSVNRPGVYVSEDAIGLLVNGEVVEVVAHSDAPVGRVGVAAGTFTESTVEVAFSNFHLWTGDRTATVAVTVAVTVAEPVTETETGTEASVEESLAEEAIAEETVAEEAVPEEAVPEEAVAEEAISEETAAPTPVPTRRTRREPGTTITPLVTPDATAQPTPTPDAETEAETDAEADVPADEAPAADEWATFEDEALRLRHPAGWTVTRSAQDRIDVVGPEDVRMTLWPLFIAQQIDAESAAVLLQALAGEDLPAANWSAPTPIENSVLRISSADDTQTAVAVLAWTNTPQGAGLAYYLFDAPTASYAQLEGAFLAILESVEIFGGAAASGANGASLEYMTWRDPVENSFTTEVPAQGWEITGGLQRHAPLQTVAWMRLQDPVRDALILYGDPQTPHYTLPNEILAFAGIHEGMWTTLSSGSSMLVSRYIPGADYAELYATEVLELASCTQTEKEPLTELANAMMSMLAPVSSGMSQIQIDAGNVAYSCETEDGPYRVAVGAMTSLHYGGGTGVWTVMMLSGYITPESHLDDVQAIHDHMLLSWRVDPEWQRAQNQIASNSSRITVETNEEIGRMMSEGFAERSAMEDRTSQSWSDMMHEVERVEDTRTGEVYEVQAGSNYHWIDNQGNILGTDAHFNPNGLYFEEMISAP